MTLFSPLPLIYILGLPSPRVNFLPTLGLSEQASLLVRPGGGGFQQGELLGTGSGHRSVPLVKPFLKSADSGDLTSALHGE